MTLGEKLQKIRMAQGLSQEQMGEMFGTTRQTVSKWELDQAVPDMKKIVAISRTFCISTDELLLAVENFANEGNRFVCGIYRLGACEIVETENYAVKYFAPEKTIMSAILYEGNCKSKKLIAACEKDIENKTVKYAYYYPDGTNSEKRSNDKKLENRLGEPFDRDQLKSMHLAERFFVDHGEHSVHTVHEKGIRQCLIEWRNGSKACGFNDGLSVLICTKKREYIFSIHEKDDDVYCGCSYNIPFDLGLRSYGQYFRLRNYKDNSAPYCSCFYDLTREEPAEILSLDYVNLACQKDAGNGNMIWFVKRYDDTEIVLQGCGEDEYYFSMDENKDERFAFE